MVVASSEEIQKVGAILQDGSKSFAERFRALFTLMNVNGDEAVKQICDTFVDPSELLKHELAFCLGQMQNTSALPKLTEVLEDPNEAIIVRHEAGEALGAIGQADSLEILNKYLNHESKVLRQTCELAVQRIKYLNAESLKSDSPFSSVDPAPAFNAGKSCKELTDILLDEAQSLFDRYRAMFSLRNMATPQAIESLVKGLNCDDSALFRHEIAYVLGQMADKHAVAGLAEKLNDFSDDPMVRHECAEALGSVDDDRCKAILTEHLTDQDIIVQQSCEIALDMNEHETGDGFQYADTLEKVRSS